MLYIPGYFKVIYLEIINHINKFLFFKMFMIYRITEHDKIQFIITQHCTLEHIIRKPDSSLLHTQVFSAMNGFLSYSWLPQHSEVTV